MTVKLPVARTITDAYRFAFLRFPSVLGSIWLPYLILIPIVFGLIRLVAPDVSQMLATGQVDLAGGMELLRLAVLVSIFAFVAAAMVTVDLQRKAMGTRRGRPYVFFSLGAPVWRMAGALFLAGIVIGVVALLAGVVGFGIWSAARSLGAAAGLIRVLTALAWAAVFIYVALRLMFFLPAVIVVENSIGLERAWTLGGHNFWRIFIVMVAIVLPVAVVVHLVSWAFFGPIAALHDLGGQTGLRALLQAGAAHAGIKGYLMLFLELLERILFFGLFNGAVASAYLAVERPPGAAVS